MLFIAKSSCLLGCLWSLVGKQESMGVCFNLGVVPAGCCFATQSIFCFDVRCRGTADNAPVSSPLTSSVCCYQFVYLCRSILFCVSMCTCLCVLGCVSKCVLAACSRCDRWSAAHAQINRPTLLKSGLCLLSNSLSLSAPHSLCLHPLSLPLFHSSVSKPRARIQRELCRIIAVP